MPNSAELGDLELEQLFRLIDEDGSSAISAHEFCEYVSSPDTECDA
eukprot:SAG31_NODE_15715_length_741_cov_1.862928_2_plen_45_part_01